MARLTPAQLLEVVSQMVHALIGAFLFYLLSVYFPGNLAAVAVTYGGLLVVEFVKEFYVDLKVEQGATVASGTLDLVMYYVGAGIAFLALVLTHRPL